MLIIGKGSFLKERDRTRCRQLLVRTNGGKREQRSIFLTVPIINWGKDGGGGETSGGGGTASATKCSFSPPGAYKSQCCDWSWDSPQSLVSSPSALCFLYFFLALLLPRVLSALCCLLHVRVLHLALNSQVYVSSVRYHIFLLCPLEHMVSSWKEVCGRLCSLNSPCL